MADASSSLPPTSPPSTFRQTRGWCPTCAGRSPLLVYRADVAIGELTCPDGHPIVASSGVDDVPHVEAEGV